MVVPHLDPGDKPTVEVVANANGNVATEGDLVQVAGEDSGNTQVALVDTAGEGVAVLTRDPDDYDPEATYAAGDPAGQSMAYMRHAVDWVTPTNAGALAPGDIVVSDVGGTVRIIDRDGTAPDDTADMIFGRVWATNQRGVQYTAGKVAVLRT